MPFEMTVIDYAGEKLFLHKTPTREVLFDALEADYAFFGGSVEVLRDGQPFSKTSSIFERGGHGGGPVFNGLSKIFGFYAAENIKAKDLQIGDTVVLDVEQCENYQHYIKTEGKKSAITLKWEKEHNQETQEKPPEHRTPEEYLMNMLLDDYDPVNYELNNLKNAGWDKEYLDKIKPGLEEKPKDAQPDIIRFIPA